MKAFFCSRALWIAGGILLLAARPAPAQGPEIIPKPPGEILYERNCASCHTNPGKQSRAPELKVLVEFTPEALYTQMTSGTMAVPAQKLTDEEKRFVAEYLGGRPLDLTRSGSADTMPNRCASNPPLGDPAASASWNGWSADRANTRFASVEIAGLTVDQVPRLELKWAFGFPGGTTAYGQPTVVSGRIFIGSDNGYFYSLNAASGCVYWSFQAKVGVRTAPVVGPVQGPGLSKYAVYFGDMRANVYALDALSGKLLWTARADDHLTARISGAPALYGGRLYVPASSGEEAVSASPSYSCCTFRGSIVAFDADSGRQLWKTYTISEDLKPTKKNSSGVQLWGPAGGAVWNSPTIDAQRDALYIGTGDAYTEPAPATTDAVEALDLKTGKVLWSFQTLANDAWILDCPSVTPTGNCPKNLGPDHDVGASPILLKTANRRILLATPKSGTVFALDPDRRGSLIWKLSLTDKTAATNGLIALGGAADSRNLYLALEDGTFVAVDLSRGKRAWTTRLESLDELGPPNAGGEPRTKTGLRFGQSAAVTGIPGAVLTGGWDGILRALSTADGKLLWQFNTAQEFKTVNDVPARGGSMGGPGPTVANGMLYVPSGYAMFGGGLPGNVLLAFAVESPPEGGRK
jgi:polyvinyl alcohol dehydrogenase (cytochrome)